MLTIKEVIKTLYNALLQRLKKHRGNWEQNDPTADDYIKNRPFYTNDVKEKFLVKNYTGNEDIPKCNFIIGQVYNVIWNGKLYENVICIDYDGWNRLGDDSYPFYIDDDGGDSLYVEADNGTFSVSISIIQENIRKIDKKYLPDFAPVATSGDYWDLYNLPTIYSDVVRYGELQELQEYQKNVARLNIDAASQSEIFNIGERVVEYTWNGNTSMGRSFVHNAWNYYKISDDFFEYDNIINIQSWNSSNAEYSISYAGTNCCMAGYFIIVYSPGTCELKMTATSSTQQVFTAPSAGIYSRYVNAIYGKRLVLTVKDSASLKEELIAHKVNKADLAKIAFSGSYYDLLDKPAAEPLSTKISIADSITGETYFIGMENGNLISTKGEITGIEIINQPKRLGYLPGQMFNPTGMIVVAKYSNGPDTNIANYSYSPEVITSSTSVVTISYTAGETTYTDSVNVYTRDVVPEEDLVDFEYTLDDSGRYLLTAWKGTYNGLPSTEIIIPANNYQTAIDFE